MAGLRILHLEDSKFDAELIAAKLLQERLECEITRVDTQQAFMDAVRRGQLDVVLADYQLPSFDGISALAIAREWLPDVPFVFASGTLGEDVAVRMLKHGATDYVVKQRLHELAPALRRAVDEARVRRDRISAEIDLRASEERYRTLTELSPQIVWMGSPEGRLTYANQRWLDYTGQTTLTSTAQVWFDFIAQDQQELVRQRWLDGLREEASFELETQLVDVGGRARWHVLRTSPRLTQGGSEISWMAIAFDVHDRKLAEDNQRRAAEAAEAANRAKDHFLAMLSHELRTPLNAIVGWSSLLRTDRLSREDILEAAAVIDRNAKVQVQLIEDLLDVTRIASGKLHLDLQPVDVRAVVEAAVDTVHALAAAKRVRIEKEIDHRVSLVNADPSRLQQVVWNLLTNGVKFTPAGGRVRVELERLEDRYHLRVIDSGEGISAEFLPHVFDRFSQADEATTTRAHGGLGLGLSIVRQLVEMHGGHVSATSEGEGLGATFTVSLPQLSQSYAESADASCNHLDCPAFDGQCPPGLDGLQILVVDDERDARELVSRVLVECDAIVVEATSVEEAIQWMQHDSPALLISDIGMPHEDGYELIRRVRALGGRKQAIPAIALTAFARPEDKTRAIAAGFQAHIPKPINPADLLEAVARLIRA